MKGFKMETKSQFIVAAENKVSEYSHYGDEGPRTRRKKWYRDGEKGRERSYGMGREKREC